MAQSEQPSLKNEVERSNVEIPSNMGMQSGVREVDSPVAEYTSPPGSPGRRYPSWQRKPPNDSTKQWEIRPLPKTELSPHQDLSFIFRVVESPFCQL